MSVQLFLEDAPMDNNSTIEELDRKSGFTYGIIFTIGMIFLVIIISIACIRLRNSSANPSMLNFLARTPPSSVAEEASVALTEPGLDDTILDSYPKLLYSEVQRGSLVSSCCTICLGDYKDAETLRLLPDCGQIFHLGCVDPWLKLHPTCPIRRRSSFQTQQSSTSTPETTAHVAYADG